MNRTIEKLIASVLGIGFLPFAPGTWASLAALFFWYFIQIQFELSSIVQIALVFFSIVVGLWSSIRLEKIWGKDPSQIVIDEWAGMWLTCLLLPADWQVLGAAFVLFRILDIWKPFWIRKAEKLKGGWGVMMDDILAGLIGNVLIRIFLWIV